MEKSGRRAFLVWFGTLGSAGLAGCASPQAPSGPFTPPQSPEGGPTETVQLVIVTFRAIETDSGNLGARLVLENRSERERTAEIIVTATVGDESFQQTETIAVQANTQAETVVEFQVSYQEYVGNGSISARIA